MELRIELKVVDVIMMKRKLMCGKRWGRRARRMVRTVMGNMVMLMLSVLWNFIRGCG